MNNMTGAKSAASPSGLFDEEYFKTGLGSPYERNAHWLNLFGGMAEETIRSLRPKTVLDAGCAMGFLVESFWDRGVEAHGFDVSTYAISQVRRDMKPYCKQASITDPIEGRYDLVTCIEVLEHLPPHQTETAVANLAAASDTILFSSTPSDLSEETHFNVRPIIGWLNLFKDAGFWPDCRFDVSFVTPHAILFRKQAPLAEDVLTLFSESIRWKMAYILRDRQNSALTQQNATLAQQVREVGQSLSDERKIAESQREQIAAASGEFSKSLEERDRLAGEKEAVAKELAQAKSSIHDFSRRLALAATSSGVEKHNGKLRAELNDATNQAQTLQAELDRTTKALNEAQRLTEARIKARLVEAEGQLTKCKLRYSQQIGLQATNEVEKQIVSLKASLSHLARQSKLRIAPDCAATRAQQSMLLHQIDVVSKSPLFDAHWYLENNPDVAAAGVNPLIHFLRAGAAEGRQPGPEFDGHQYLNHYADVAAAGFNPLLHYLEFGRNEGRQIWALKQIEEAPAQTPEIITSNNGEVSPEIARRATVLNKSPLFDPGWYLEAYPDVAEAKLDPVIHFLTAGAAEGRNPSKLFDVKWYLKNHPDVADAKLNPLLHYVEHGAAENRPIRPVADGNEARQLVREHFIDSMPILTMTTPRAGKRVNIVTNGIEAARLYGGVGTALIFGTLLAKKMEADLRIITRREAPVPGNFAHILHTNAISWDKDIDFLYAPVERSKPVPISEQDIFLTTSWWTTKSLRDAVAPASIVYLLQEDERMFYPFGDERLRCETTIIDPSIRYVVNSELLFRHLAGGEEPCPNIAQNGTWFEPAFPEGNFFRERASAENGKRKLFFYARPNNSRNLFWCGLQVLIRALESGILSPLEWEFHFAGADFGKVTLPGKPVVKIHQNLPWSQYAALVRQMDLGLCLMDTPHPSYPPLDLAASGAVVVTNRRGIKHSLSQYSENILCMEPTVNELSQGLKQAVELVNNEKKRMAQYSNNGLLRDWNLALQPAIDWVCGGIAAGSR